MRLDIQRFGGRGASSSNSKLDIEVGKTYVNKNGTTFKITGIKNGKYEFIEMGNKGIADETEIKRIMKEQGYKYENSTSSARNMLQERINNEKTRLYGDEGVMVIKGDKVVLSTKLRNINNKQYEDELRKSASKVVFRKDAKVFMIYQK